MSAIAPALPAQMVAPAALRSSRWPYLVFLSYPVFWILGLPWMWGPLVTFPMLVFLLRRLPTLRVPKGFGLWVLFLGWMLVTGAQLLGLGSDRIIAFVYRGSFYYAATVAFLFFFNVDRKTISSESVVRAITAFWLLIVALGFVGLVAPPERFSSLATKILPASVLADKTIWFQAHPQFAQNMNIIGRPVPRAAAPFGASNVWGTNVGMTVPFVFMAYQLAERRRTKVLLAGALGASLIPFVMSLNRGAWIAVSLGIIYAAGRSLLKRGGLRQLFRVGVPLCLVIGVIMLSPLVGIINARIAHGHSDAGRLAGDVEATQRVTDSPIFGYGAPLPSEDNVDARHDVGTHGQIWLVVFSQGVPGLLLYLSWFGFVFWHTRRARTPGELWINTLVLIAVAMMPVYGILGTGLFILMSGIAVALRDDVMPSAPAAPSVPSVPVEVASWR